MIIKNGTIVNGAFELEDMDIRVKDGVITEIGKDLCCDGEEVVDASEKYVIPGLIDVHSHGCAGCDFCDGKIDSFEKMAKYYADNGITSFLGTSMSLSEELLTDIFKEFKKFKDNDKLMAYSHGINMEGPFFSKAKKGAQKEEYIVNPDIDMFRRLNEASGNNVRIVDIAPELDGADEFIKEFKDEVTVSIAHTTADYETAKKAIELGVTHITHLYNAMSPFNHRNPGVPGAVFDDDTVRAELICDGIHIHQGVIRSTFKTLGDDRVILISDSMRACGMKDGVYDLGGQQVYVKGNLATLEDGTIAGSATNVMQCMRNAVSYGIPFTSAVKAATINPAKAAGVDKTTGSLEEGKTADIVILSKDKLDVETVLIKGKKYR